MDAVILAGGKGTRLRELYKNTPKPLIKIGSKPLVEHQVNLLKNYGFNKIWILSGYLGEKIKDYVGNGRKWGLNIKHIIESKPLGTAGALKQLDGKINKDFVVFSGDVMLDIDLKRLVKFHKSKTGSVATIVVHPNDHPFDSDLVDVNKNYKVTSFLIRRNKTQQKNLIFRNLANAGVFIFSPKIFENIRKNEFSDLERDIFPKILKKHEAIYAYNTAEYIKDVGALKRLTTVRHDYNSGKIAKLNLKNKRKAIFLDRDGTILRQDSIHNVTLSKFKLYPFTAEAIKKINRVGFLAIVITNQPAIAKGIVSEAEVELIHRKLETELGKNGAIVNGIYYCPHHPETGFRGEIKVLKIKCSCRKPKTELVKKAVRDFNIDLEKSFFIGDSTTDAKCAENAGVKFIGVKTGYSLKDNKYKISKKLILKKDLLEAVNLISRKNL